MYSVKTSDLYRMALKGWGRMAITPFLFFTLAFCLLINAQTMQSTLQQEKKQPCELILTGENLTDTDVVKISEIDDILQATLIYPVSALIQVDSFQAEVILYGISGNYLEQTLGLNLNSQSSSDLDSNLNQSQTPIPELGNIFPETSSMPYLFLNEAAVNELMKVASKADTNINYNTSQQNQQGASSYDWLNADVTITPDNGKPVISRICGMESIPGTANDPNEMSGENTVSNEMAVENTAQYYISIQIAKELILNAGAIPSANEIRVRITGSGQEESVSAQLQNLGYSVENSDAAENSDSEKWKNWQYAEQRIASTLFTAAISLFAAIALLKEKLELDRILHLKEYQHLEQLGFGQNTEKIRILHHLNKIRIGGIIFASAGLSVILNAVIFLLFKKLP